MAGAASRALCMVVVQGTTRRQQNRTRRFGDGPVGLQAGNAPPAMVSPTLRGDHTGTACCKLVPPGCRASWPGAGKALSVMMSYARLAVPPAQLIFPPHPLADRHSLDPSRFLSIQSRATTARYAPAGTSFGAARQPSPAERLGGQRGHQHAPGRSSSLRLAPRVRLPGRHSTVRRRRWSHSRRMSEQHCPSRWLPSPSGACMR